MMAVSGSRASGETTVTGYVYDVTNDVWSSLPSLSVYHGAGSGVFLGDDTTYLVCGGAYTTVCEAIDMNNVGGGWGSRASLSYKLFNHRMVRSPFTNRAVAIGGRNDDTRSSVTYVEEYNQGTNAWASLPSMSQAREDFVAAAVGGNIYVAGGATGDGAHIISTEKFDGSSWSFVASMPVSTAQAYGASFEGKLVVVGGAYWHDGSSRYFLDTPYVYVYNPSSDSWSSSALPNLITGRSLYGIASVSGLPTTTTTTTPTTTTTTTTNKKINIHEDSK
jgi:N-acetylneuraminic acid mutarotase